MRSSDPLTCPIGARRTWNRPRARGGLLRAVWGLEYGNELEYLRSYIKELRKKIEDDPAHPKYLLTEPRVGYRLCDSPEVTLAISFGAGI
jgi:DNA-binding response OmpR family regulator